MTAIEWDQKLLSLAQQVAKALNTQDQKCVFAESCTGGKMAAAMTTVPGISGYFCGSAVTYREATKTKWLAISSADLELYTAESAEATNGMAESVLSKTPEANVAVAITGHLGPGIDEEIDGKIFLACAKRIESDISLESAEARLKSESRIERQAEAACEALSFFLSKMQ